MANKYVKIYPTSLYHQGNTNQNHNGVSPQFVGMAVNKTR